LNANANSAIADMRQNPDAQLKLSSKAVSCPLRDMRCTKILAWRIPTTTPGKKRYPGGRRPKGKQNQVNRKVRSGEI
jgi:hypothetical protein